MNQVNLKNIFVLKKQKTKVYMIKKKNRVERKKEENQSYGSSYIHSFC